MHNSLRIEVKIEGWRPPGCEDGEAQNSDGPKSFQNQKTYEIPTKTIDGNSEKPIPLDKRASSSSGAGDPLMALAFGRRNLLQQATNLTLTSTAHLTKFLPCGTHLVFQMLCPTYSSNGQCDSFSRSLTRALLIVCGISIFMASFTDSFRDRDGKIHYGFVTPKGLWAFDHPATEIPEAARYRLRFVDFVHAFMSVLVFLAIALYNQDVVSCLYPAPKSETKKGLNVLSMSVGVVCGLLFVLLPTRRHGLGFPVSNR